MALNFNTLQKTCPPWFRTPGAEDDVILGIMGRLVRNLRGHAFPGWSTAEGRQAVAGQLLPAILAQPGFKTAYHAEVSNLDYGYRRALLEQLSTAADDGAPLHQIFRESGVFPHYVCALVEVGERVGRTEETLRSLGNYYDARVRLLRQLKSSLLYPAVLLAVMLVVV
ncbi:MAG: type II secretion system F family protein, partial [Akkermansia sp.]|nr:type II secretion system F family protein [Akkermansia sp.]